MTGIAASEPLKQTEGRPEPMSERIVVRGYASYREAKRAVDCLRVGRVPPRSITVLA